MQTRKERKRCLRQSADTGEEEETPDKRARGSRRRETVRVMEGCGKRKGERKREREREREDVRKRESESESEIT